MSHPSVCLKWGRVDVNVATASIVDSQRECPESSNVHSTRVSATRNKERGQQFTRRLSPMLLWLRRNVPTRGTPLLLIRPYAPVNPNREIDVRSSALRQAQVLFRARAHEWVTVYRGRPWRSSTNTPEITELQPTKPSDQAHSMQRGSCAI